MSGNNFNNDQSVLADPSLANERPAHHLHGGEEPLRPVADYSVEALEGRPRPQTTVSEMYGSVPDVNSHRGEQDGANAFNSERPIDVQPTSEGGVAVEGREGLPVGKANAMDKIVGKTEKVMGKIMKKPQMHEAGELRESGGKAAVRGEARAPHD